MKVGDETKKGRTQPSFVKRVFHCCYLVPHSVGTDSREIEKPIAIAEENEIEI